MKTLHSGLPLMLNFILQRVSLRPDLNSYRLIFMVGFEYQLEMRIFWKLM